MELPAPVFLGCHTPFFDTSIENYNDKKFP